MPYVNTLSRINSNTENKDAVRWRVFQQTVEETEARTANVPQEEIDTAIDEALTAVHAEREDTGEVCPKTIILSRNKGCREGYLWARCGPAAAGPQRCEIIPLVINNALRYY